MTREEFVEKLRFIVADEMGVAPDEEVLSSTKLEEDLGMDDVDLTELLITAEDEFGVDLFEIEEKIISELPELTFDMLCNSVWACLNK